MNNLDNLESKLKRSIQTNKCKPKPFEPTEEEGRELIKYEKSGKRKMTFYISQKCESMINQLFTARIMMGEKVDKSKLICQAIESMFRSI